MKGVVFDSQTKQYLEADFELTDLSTGEITAQSVSDKITGEFLVCLPANRHYALTVSREGYLFYSENFNLAHENSSLNPTLRDVPLEPLKVGSKVILKNIFFETDQFELRESSKVELQILLELLNRNPKLKIEISGHTDNTGSHDHNLTLSANRAKAVNDYLVLGGIGQNRLTYKGYAETIPVDSNETEQGRANNRRTEFKVIE
jgi:outer membrane protein OmpA-like peptidoglycan-associated protein